MIFLVMHYWSIERSLTFTTVGNKTHKLSTYANSSQYNLAIFHRSWFIYQSMLFCTWEVRCHWNHTLSYVLIASIKVGPPPIFTAGLISPAMCIGFLLDITTLAVSDYMWPIWYLPGFPASYGIQLCSVSMATLTFLLSGSCLSQKISILKVL